MRYRMMVFLAGCLAASAVAAQSVSAPASDIWSVPAAASSTASHAGQAPVSKPSTSPFKFKSDQRSLPADQPPPSVMDKASVMGTERPWQNGRPPADCASSPHNAACQH